MTSRRLRIKQDRWMTLAELGRDLPDLTDWPAKRIAEARSALNLLARVVGRPLAEIPADPEPIRKILGDAPWQVHDVKKQRWANVRSLIVGTLYEVGVLSIRSRQARCLLPEWQALLGRLHEASLAQKLSRFGRWCSSKALCPDDVAIETFERFAAELTELSLIKHPRKEMHTARRAWNKAIEQVADWPRLHVPSPEDQRCYSLPWDAFPESLHKEIEDYRRERLSPDPFNDEHRAIRPITVRQHLDQLRRHASRLVQAGVPREGLVNLAILLKPEFVKRSLAPQLDDPRHTTPRASATANALCAVAQYLKLPDEQVCELRRMASRLRYRPNGMTPKNKERLARLRGNKALRRLIQLPASIAVELEKVKKPEYRHATRMRLAVAVEILQMAPMRVANLAALDLQHHFGQVDLGKDKELQLSIPADEVKNREPLEYVLPESSARILTLYRERFRPLLTEAPSSKLFPCRSGGAMTSASLARCIREGIKRELGLTINAHLFRHHGAFLYLSNNPGDYETVRRVLGHKSITTTVAFYAGIEMEHSVRRFDEAVLRLRDKASDWEDADVL